MSGASTAQPRRILLGVTGGIAAYKSPELVRRLTERGCCVQVVMTRAAREFVAPITFQAVSGRRVREALWDQAAEAAMGHIELARWADLLLVAPASANFIGELAGGLAGDLLSTLCLATSAPTVLAPAMNHVMWSHPAVQANRALLASRGVRFLGPAEGDQACGESGPGRMLEPEEIARAVLETAPALRSGVLSGLRVVVSAGPTREAIDPVRYITNRSSGKMGFAIAAAARSAGAEVVLVSGPVGLAAPEGVRRVDVETAGEMYDRVQREMEDTDIFIACAAVADYRPRTVSREKLKRTEETMSLDLVRSPDTLAGVAALENAPFTVGFAAETEHVARYAREKLAKKGLDMIAANEVGPGCGFDRETNALTVFWKGGETALGESSKTDLATRLIELIAERYRAVRPARAASPRAV
jgi:phosphopantothenoylcysteine decarboxylase/phosphopantothenate--cysteine ligase